MSFPNQLHNNGEVPPNDPSMQSGNGFSGQRGENHGVSLQLASQLLSSALTNALSRSTPPTQQSIDQNAAQLLQLAQSQGVNSSQLPNQFLLQQLGLQQLVQQNMGGQVPEQPPPPKQAKSTSQANEAKVNSSTSRKSEKDKPKRHMDSIVPCRARGMPSSHNSGSAYFVIPRDVRHGENLLCSYPQCRNEGVKFCYCAHCGIPVAKRNFRQRHDHALKRERGKEYAITQKASPAEARASAPQRDPKQPSGIAKAGHTIKKDKDKDNARAKAKAEAKAKSKSKKGRSKRSSSDGLTESDRSNNDNNGVPMKSLVFKTKKNAPVSEIDDAALGSSRIGESRQLRWGALLHARPSETESDDMSKWLLAVLDVSNPKYKNESQPRASRAYPAREAASSRTRTNDDSSDSGVLDSSSADFSSSETFSSGGSSTSDNDKFVKAPPNPGRTGVHHPASNIVSDFRNSTESSGSTDQSGGVDTTSGTNELSNDLSGNTSGEGTNGSSGDGDSPQENSSSGSEQDLADLIAPKKRPSTNTMDVQRHHAKKRKQEVAHEVGE